jgi:hypothetical protein
MTTTIGRNNRLTILRHVPGCVVLTAGFGQPQVITVSLAAPPWGELERCDRAVTALRTAPVRSARRWDQNPVLRHADTRKDRG